ncbi:zinc finger protein 862-like [Ascaphus truei]|uniref:zinc finger protein 862-like n=1 Tax=Ascaphus truei TaxID=8439 RepID=UPI003F5A9251
MLTSFTVRAVTCRSSTVLWRGKEANSCCVLIHILDISVEPPSAFQHPFAFQRPSSACTDFGFTYQPGRTNQPEPNICLPAPTVCLEPTSAKMSNKTRQTSLLMFFGDKNQGPSQRVNQTETVEDTPPDQDTPIATKLIHKRRIFQDSWLEDFTWLEYNKESDVASCIICSNVAHKTDVTPPTHIRHIFNAPFKLETFKYHVKSSLHIKFAKILSAQKNPESTPMGLCVKKMEKEMFQQMCVVFNSAYYIAKTNKPFSDIKDLLNYTRKLGVHVLEQYSNDKRCAEFVKFIAEKIRNDIVAEVKSSSFFSVLLDGSTDKSTTEQLIMYMKYCKDGCIKEKILSIVPLQIGTGQGYFDALQEELLKYGLHWRNC